MRILRKDYRKLSDEDLMRAISKGEKNAFDEIYARYAGPIGGYFKRRLWNDSEKAEDFAHDLFAKIIKKPEYFDPNRTFKTWFYSVANNMCKNEYKKQEVRKNTVSGVEDMFYVSDANANVMNEVQDAFFREKFAEKLDALDEKHKTVFDLRHIQGMSIKEVAEVMEISEGTVKSRVFYASKYLAEGLKEFKPIEK